MSSLWLSLQPAPSELRLSLSRASCGTVLRARFPLIPRQPQALVSFMEAISCWFGEPLTAVLDAESEDVRLRPDFWAVTLGAVDLPHVRVEWVSLPSRAQCRDRFLGGVASGHRAGRLISFAAGGQR
jgi:hypothetical protein